jgi:cytidyltransferase-like protein
VKILNIGTFDVLHYGHIDFLRRCAELGDLIVGVNTDEFVATFKEPPVMDYQERCMGIVKLGYPVRQNKSAGRELIKQVRPNFIISGSDWARKDWFRQIDMTQDLFDEWGIGVIYLPRITPGISPMSSTEIKRRIREA